MWPNRSSSFLLTLLLAAVAAGAAYDPVASVEIRSARDTVLAARTVQLEARAYTEFGREIDGFAPRWRSLQPEIASVDENGLVRGLAPGVVEIEAADPDSSEAAIRILRVFPARVEITPDRLDVEIGETRAFTARALDADNQVIPGVRFAWRSSLSGVAAIDAQGLMRAVAEGSAQIIALIEAGPGYQYSAFVQVRVRRRAEFTYPVVISNETTSAPLTLLSIESWASTSQSDDVALVGTLSNGSSALLLIQRGQMRRLATAGEYLEAAGGVIASLSSVSMNSAGDVLARFSLTPRRCRDGYVLFRGGRTQVLWGACPVPTAAELNERGDLLYALPTGTNGSEVAIRRANGVIEYILRFGQTLPGVGVPNIWYANFTATGGVVFGGNPANGGNYSIYYWDGRQIEQLATMGGSVAGLPVNNFGNIVQTSNGDLFLMVDFNGNHRILKRSGNVWSTLLANSGEPLTGDTSFCCINYNLAASGEALIFSVNTAEGWVFYRWLQNRFERLGLGNDAAEIRTGPQSSIVFRNWQGTRISRLSTSGPQTLVSTGTMVPGIAPTALDWDRLVLGGSANAMLARTSGGTLVRISDGRLETVAAPGRVIDGQNVLIRINESAVSTGGEMVLRVELESGPALYTYRNSALTLIADSSSAYTTEQGDPIHWLGWPSAPLAINRQRQVVSWAQWRNGEGLLLFTEGQRAAKIVMRGGNDRTPNSLGGGISEVVIDNNGRIAFILTPFNRGPSVWAWQNGQLTRLIEAGEQIFPGIRPNWFYSLSAPGTKLLMMFDFPGGRRIVEYAAGAWKSLTREARPGLAPEFVENFSANAAGDILIFGNIGNNRAVILRRADGKESVVSSVAQQLAPGSWPIDFGDVSLNDAGEIFFSALISGASADRMVLFRAAPR